MKKRLRFYIIGWGVFVLLLPSLLVLLRREHPYYYHALYAVLLAVGIGVWTAAYWWSKQVEPITPLSKWTHVVVLLLAPLLIIAVVMWLVFTALVVTHYQQTCDSPFADLGTYCYDR